MNSNWFDSLGRFGMMKRDLRCSTFVLSSKNDVDVMEMLYCVTDKWSEIIFRMKISPFFPRVSQCDEITFLAQRNIPHSDKQILVVSTFQFSCEVFLCNIFLWWRTYSYNYFRIILCILSVEFGFFFSCQIFIIAILSICELLITDWLQFKCVGLNLK